MWDLIVSVPDHCLSFYFLNTDKSKDPSKNVLAITGELTCKLETLKLN